MPYRLFHHSLPQHTATGGTKQWSHYAASYYVMCCGPLGLGDCVVLCQLALIPGVAHIAGYGRRRREGRGCAPYWCLPGRWISITIHACIAPCLPALAADPFLIFAFHSPCHTQHDRMAASTKSLSWRISEIAAAFVGLRWWHRRRWCQISSAHGLDFSGEIAPQ